MIKTIEWDNGKVVMIDQLMLPQEEVYRTYTTSEEVAKAIEEMVIRGAPAIGVAAAMGIALGMQTASKPEEFSEICKRMGRTRPTAVNLFWAIERMKRRYNELQTHSVEE